MGNPRHQPLGRGQTAAGPNPYPQYHPESQPVVSRGGLSSSELFSRREHRVLRGTSRFRESVSKQVLVHPLPGADDLEEWN